MILKCKYYMKNKKNFIQIIKPQIIFVIINLNEKTESINDATSNLCRHLLNEFKVSIQNSVVVLFSIETRRVRIRTGEKTKKEITDDECEEIIEDLGPILRKKNYYEVWLSLLEKLDYYMNEDSSKSIMDYVITIFTYFCIGYLFIFIMQKIRNCRYLPSDEKLKKIVEFLKNQKSNKNIFSENCIICLEKFEYINDESIDLNINDESKTVKLINEKDISVLNCGHQFHSNCIANWLKKINTCQYVDKLLILI